MRRLFLPLSVAALCGCAVLRPKPAALVLDAPGLAKVARVIVIPGESKYAGQQERLLFEVEEALAKGGCWAVTSHERLRASEPIAPIPLRIPHSPFGLPQKLHNFLFEPFIRGTREAPASLLHAAVSGRLERPDERVALLFVWVDRWEGQRYRELNVVKDAASALLGGAVNAVLNSKDEDYYYSRAVSARLVESAGGALLWRMDRRWIKKEKLDEFGLIPWATEEQRAAEEAREYGEFRELIAGELVKGGGAACAARGTALP